MAYTATLIPGDGIGPGITTAPLRVLAAAGAPTRLDEYVPAAPAA